MAIKHKSGGAYTDVVGVFHKRAGAYEAVQGVYVKTAGVYGRVDAPPVPTTVNYTASQFSSGLFGSISTTKNAARIYGRARLTGWVGVITGTEAKLTATSDFGANLGLIQASVDDGAYVDCAVSAGVFTLFSGLPHGPHKVIWRFGTGYGDVPYILATGNILAVTGQPPSITPPVNSVALAVTTSTSLWSSEINTNTAGYTPLLARGTSDHSNTSTIRLRGTISTLFIAGTVRYVHVSKNGAAPTRYLVASANTATGKILTGLGGELATYNIWARPEDGDDQPNGGHFFVGTDVALSDIGSRRRLDQYGDSITFGTNSTSRGDVDTLRVAAALGFAGSTSGVGGHTIAQTDTLLTSALPRRTISGNDVAIVAVGRNNVGGAFDAAEISGYQSIISKLLAAGYGKVLCRGILPDATRTTTFPAENGSISAIVSGLGNPNVIFVDVSACPVYGSPDNVHPNDAGYVTIAEFVQPLYAAALGF